MSLLRPQNKQVKAVFLKCIRPYDAPCILVRMMPLVYSKIDKYHVTFRLLSFICLLVYYKCASVAAVATSEAAVAAKSAKSVDDPPLPFDPRLQPSP
jgi:hypothetical protein